MSVSIRHLTVVGLHNRLDIGLKFSDRVNVIYGLNGNGKTTVLHILANALNGSYDRFAFLEFKTIDIRYTDGTDEHQLVLDRRRGNDIQVLLDGTSRVSISATDVVEQYGMLGLRGRPRQTRDEYHYEEPYAVGDVAYFPAFRSAVDGLSDIDLRRASQMPPDIALTDAIRLMYGPFVPIVRYPSLAQIQDGLAIQQQRAEVQVSARNQEAINEAIVGVLEALSEPEDTVSARGSASLASVKQALEALDSGPVPAAALYERLREALGKLESQGAERPVQPIFAVYERLLNKQVKAKEEAFSALQAYLDTVNDFLTGKSLAVTTGAQVSPIRDYRPRRPYTAVIRFPDKSWSDLQCLSSGERQIVTMLYAIANLERQSDVLLIDEPEMSLHIEWQRKFMAYMTKTEAVRQVIVCTHSPEIGAGFELVRLAPNESRVREQ